MDTASIGNAAGVSDPKTSELPVLHHLSELEQLVKPELFVRFSRGPDEDRGTHSRDYESGLDLPGLSVSPLQPEEWWKRPAVEWLARQLCSYVHLRDDADDERRPWVLTGQVVARGPDNEPIIGSYRPLAWLSDELIDEAKALYTERFDAGEDST